MLSWVFCLSIAPHKKNHWSSQKTGFTMEWFSLVILTPSVIFPDGLVYSRCSPQSGKCECSSHTSRAKPALSQPLATSLLFWISISTRQMKPHSSKDLYLCILVHLLIDVIWHNFSKYIQHTLWSWMEKIRFIFFFYWKKGMMKLCASFYLQGHQDPRWWGWGVRGYQMSNPGPSTCKTCALLYEPNQKSLGKIDFAHKCKSEFINITSFFLTKSAFFCLCVLVHI